MPWNRKFSLCFTILFSKERKSTILTEKHINYSRVISWKFLSCVVKVWWDLLRFEGLIKVQFIRWFIFFLFFTGRMIHKKQHVHSPSRSSMKSSRVRLDLSFFTFHAFPNSYLGWYLKWLSITSRYLKPERGYMCYKLYKWRDGTCQRHSNMSLKHIRVVIWVSSYTIEVW